MRDLQQWENGGYFVLRPEIFDVLREGEDLVADASPPAGRRSARCWPTRYKGFWRRPTRSRTGSSWRSCTSRGNCPWMVWDPERSAARARAARRPPRLDLAVTVLPAARSRRRAGRFGCWPSAPTRTTSRSARAGPLLTLAEASPGSSVRYVVLTGTAERQRRGARAAAARSCPAPSSPSTCTTCRTAGCPRTGPRSRTCSSSRAGGLARTWCWRRRAGRRPPGPPDRSREIVPTVFREQLVPAYEIPKWDGDLGRPVAVRPADRRRSRGARSSCCTSASRRSGPATGGTTRCSSAWPGCAAWSAGPSTPRHSTAPNLRFLAE